MTSTIDEILSELYKIDPTLRSHEAVLRRVIPIIASNKPRVVVDDAFVLRLRQELMHAHASRALAPVPSPFSFFFAHGFAVPALVAMLIVSGAVIAIRGNGTDTMKLAIATSDARAFGSLAPTASASFVGGKNAGPETISAVSPTATDVRTTSASGAGIAATASVAAPAVGFGGGMPTDIGTYPSSRGIRYVYGGDTFTIPETGYVYKRVDTSASGTKLVSALNGMNFGVAIGSFSALKVRNIEVAEDRDYGYAINLSVPQGLVSINANWEKWHMDKRQGAGVLASDIPSDADLIAIADQFMKDHRINMASYASPVIDEGWREMPRVMALDGRALPAYAPDTIMITYPLMLDGMPVYESWGIPSGLQVLVDIREKKVSSVNNLTTLSYERSAYTLQTDAAYITLVATQSSDAPTKLMRERDSASTRVLDTPQVVLMKYYRDVASRNEELLIPAMRFPIRGIKDASVPSYIIVPLVKDVVDSMIPVPVGSGPQEGDGSGVACTMDAKACPDGSYVGRTGPSCEFAPCPGTKGTQEIKVKIGEKGSANGVSIMPTEVLEDSRCPVGMMCIQAGTVRVQTTLGSGLGSGSAPQIFALNMPITTETEVVTLTEVTPLKRAGTTISPSEYQFVFSVSKR